MAGSLIRRYCVGTKDRGSSISIGPVTSGEEEGQFFENLDDPSITPPAFLGFSIR